MQTGVKETILNLELTNSIIHGIGILFGIASIPLLTALAIHTNNIHSVVGASIYGFCFLMLFTFSTLYHGFQQPKVKQVLQVFDHISIYFLIAGTYTPFILNYLYNTTGIIMLCVLWSLVLIGIIFKIFFVNRFNILSTIVYLLMGWMMVWGGKSFFISVPLCIPSELFFISRKNGNGIILSGIYLFWQQPFATM